MSGEFPHGTPEGYRRGCRGIACANHGSETLMTCDQAQVRFAGDYAYRRQVLAGTATAEREVFAGEGRAQSRKPGAVVLVQMASDPVLPTPTFDPEADEPGSKEAPVIYSRSIPAPVEKPKRRRGRKTLEIVHGTRRGYVKGCRDREACPAALEGGESCKEAHNRYGRELKASKTGEPVAPAKTPKPAPAVVPAPVPVEVPEEAWAALNIQEVHQADEVVGLRSENAKLRDRVASLELELDVVRAKVRDEQRRLVALVDELFKEAS